MKKKNVTIILGALCMLCFMILPVATANDYITYGDVNASFNAFFNGGMAIDLQGENELVATHLPAVWEGLNGRIIPWELDQTLRYEDAKGIWSMYYITENDLNIWADYFGFTYDNIIEGCRYFMSWFYASYYLNGVELDVTTTPLKRGQFYISPTLGDEILWWYSEGILYKPKALDPGTYNLETIFYIDIPGLGLMMYDYSNIYFDII